jgi:hypothetical protein
VWHQAADVVQILVAAQNAQPHRTALYARGHNASLAAAYALAAMKAAPPVWAAFREGFTSYHQFIDRPASLPASYHLEAKDDRDRRLTAFDREIPSIYFPFRALEITDLPELMLETQTHLFLIDPINGDWQPAAAAEVSASIRGRITTEAEFLAADW